ncbi:hypothetical protein Tco_0914343 [Tanacetum coccineum]
MERFWPNNLLLEEDKEHDNPFPYKSHNYLFCGDFLDYRSFGPPCGGCSVKASSDRRKSSTLVIISSTGMGTLLFDDLMWFFETCHSGIISSGEYFPQFRPFINAISRKALEPSPGRPVKGQLEHPAPYWHRSFSRVSRAGEAAHMVFRIGCPIIEFNVGCHLVFRPNEFYNPSGEGSPYGFFEGFFEVIVHYLFPFHDSAAPFPRSLFLEIQPYEADCVLTYTFLFNNTD